MLILLICCVTVAIFLMKYVDKVKNKRSYELLARFPSYTTYPLIGNLHLLYGSLNHLMRKFEQLVLPHHRLLLWFGFTPAILLEKYDDIMAVSISSQDRGEVKGFLEDIGIGILNSKQKEWKETRKIMSAAFSSEFLLKYFDVFKRQSEAFVDALKPVSDSNQIIDVWNYVANVNMNNILENVTGLSHVPIPNLQQKKEEFFHAIQRGSQLIFQRAITPWLYPRFIYRIYMEVTRKIKINSHLRDLPQEILKTKLNDLKGQIKMKEDAGSSNAMIDLLIKEGLQKYNFSEIRLRDELVHMIIAGAETTSLNVSFLLLHLAIDQDKQQKVYEEIEQLFENNNTLTADHVLNGLKYLEQCIKETSRMYAHATCTVRLTHKECILKDNLIIPANTFVLVLVFLANKDPELYKNPETWDPEHFSEEAEKSRPKGSFMSFGYGPRSCIGVKYAMMSIKTQILHVLRNYHLTTDLKEIRKDQLQLDISIRSTIGYPIRFAKRKTT